MPVVNSPVRDLVVAGAYFFLMLGGASWALWYALDYIRPPQPALAYTRWDAADKLLGDVAWRAFSFGMGLILLLLLMRAV